MTLQLEERPAIGYRWGGFVARRRWAVLGAWIVLIVLGGLSTPLLNSALQSPDFTVHNADSARASELTTKHFPQLGDGQGVIVFDSPTLSADSPEFRSAVTDAVEQARSTQGVGNVVGPFDALGGQISDDRHAALAVVALTGTPSERAITARKLQDELTATNHPDMTVGLTGIAALQNDLVDIEIGDITKAEAIGIPVALLILVFALGAVVAAALPIGVGLAGLALTTGLLFLLSGVTSINVLTVSIASMIGIGIGIDYAMFIVSRFREELARGKGVTEAIGIAMSTTGKTVVASGLIVTIALGSLVVIDAPIFRGIALGVGISIVSTMLVALTFLPALLAVLGPKVNRWALPARFRPAEVTNTTETSRWARWAHLVMARPVLFGVGATLVLLVGAAPLTSMSLGIDMGMAYLDKTPSGAAAQTVSTKFAPGALAPLTVVSTDGARNVDQLAAQIARDDRVASSFVQRADGQALIVVISETATDSPETSELVAQLRRQAGSDYAVGGPAAEFLDLSDEINAKLPAVIGFVLIVSFAFLVVVFRSILLPVKAILMNLLATGAALGLTVAIFQWGYGESVLGFHSVGFLQVFLPTIVFVVLFGLSMDYEVFLIRRMKERWDANADKSDEGNRVAVAEGLAITGRPITAAAAIMVVVFGSFVTASVLELKQLGLALAVAVAIDAIIVRMMLVPAFMRLFGHRNWWLPSLRRS
ncbi:MMPL family transporter [Antrihabitans sp. YC3-6]|uniref:MMPL family transporter n=1 Tax=Antrihabitans stalagmiti TaxID=2799499 RepID=A0A934U3N0_9NOCA|nr:MMPL family transporter [Antrihabitans stalagmiti]MBJ8339662.1 MMPL family transporter [Antrihabitans stalagmiti]